MRRNIHILLAGFLMAGCSSTAPVMDITKWNDLSSTHSHGSISWRAPDSVTQTRFTQHLKHVSEQISLNKKSYDVFWWKGYDVNSWGYPAFIMEISFAKYTKPYSNLPSMESFRQDQEKLWSGSTSHHTMDAVTLGGNNWLMIAADYDEEYNRCRRVQFQLPLNGECYLNVMAEYDNEARRDVKWLESRMSIMSNVVQSIRLTSTN
jgi:hypothetical protein